MIPENFSQTQQKEKELNKYLSQFEYKEEDSHLPPDEFLKKEYESSDEFKLKQFVNDSFKKEYKKYINSNQYFLGCPFKIYENNYNNRLKAFQSKYIDAEESDFIQDELQQFLDFSLPNYIEYDIKKAINYSIRKTKNYLIEKLKQDFEVKLINKKKGVERLSIKSETQDLSIEQTQISNIEWKAGKTDLVELGMALIASGSVNVGNRQLSENKFYTQLADFFNVKINHERLKQDVRNRSKDETIFLPRINSILQKEILDRLK